MNRLKTRFEEQPMAEGDAIVVIGQGNCIASAIGKNATAHPELI